MEYVSGIDMNMWSKALEVAKEKENLELNAQNTLNNMPRRDNLVTRFLIGFGIGFLVPLLIVSQNQSSYTYDQIGIAENIMFILGIACGAWAVYMPIKKTKELKKKYSDLIDERDRLMTENSEIFDFFPLRYFTADNVGRIFEYLSTGRADTLGNAFNLLDIELSHVTSSQLMAQQQQHYSLLENKLQNIQETQNQILYK